MWHFQCDECGFGDRETGWLAGDEDWYCEICLEESRRYVWLRRWPAETADLDYVARVRVGFAA